MSISVGIVGVGMFGQDFVKLFRDHPRVGRLAICDMQPERLKSVAGRFGITETYSSLDDICRTNLEAIAIFTQPWLHAPQAIQAMEAGKCVYSAVPVISLESGDRMLEWIDKVIAACRRTGKHYMMGETSYYRPEAMYCRRRAAEGAFGRFVLAEGEYLHDIDSPECNLRDVAKARWGKDWDISKSGNVPMHYPTHSLGGFLSAMPDAHITKVSAIGYVYPNDDWHRADTASGNIFGDETAFCRISNGAVARVCEYRRIGHTCREGLKLFGTDGSFVDSPAGCFWVDKSKSHPLTIGQMRDPLPPDVLESYRRRGGEIGEGVYGYHGGSHAFLIHEFVDSVAKGRRPAIDAWTAARFFVPGIMAHKSAMKDGQWLDVPDWGDGPR